MKSQLVALALAISLLAATAVATMPRHYRSTEGTQLMHMPLEADVLNGIRVTVNGKAPFDRVRETLRRAMCYTTKCTGYDTNTDFALGNGEQTNATTFVIVCNSSSLMYEALGLPAEVLKFAGDEVGVRGPITVEAVNELLPINERGPLQVVTTVVNRVFSGVTSYYPFEAARKDLMTILQPANKSVANFKLVGANTTYDATSKKYTSIFTLSLPFNYQMETAGIIWAEFRGRGILNANAFTDSRFPSYFQVTSAGVPLITSSLPYQLRFDIHAFGNYYVPFSEFRKVIVDVTAGSGTDNRVLPGDQMLVWSSATLVNDTTRVDTQNVAEVFIISFRSEAQRQNLLQAFRSKKLILPEWVLLDSVTEVGVSGSDKSSSDNKGIVVGIVIAVVVVVGVASLALVHLRRGSRRKAAGEQDYLPGATH